MTKQDSEPETLTEMQFMRLFVQHEPVLRCVARSMLSDWMAVDDVLQEAGVTMWEKIAQLDSADGFLPWARVIVRLKCHSAINSTRRRRLVLSDQAIKLLSVEIDTVDRERYETSLNALQDCLQKLSPQQRDIVLAPYRDGIEVQDIATRIGKSANALYKQLGRLREKVFACVELALKIDTSEGGLAP
ncbi:sigma-70 family RNA polymerase sigma factor [Allorhodopirellula solitaria]|uniref:RNA polymerase sigma factor n=1 Tax=Allorhodopirellula solitaria TaxID=2527987 RepID=A0A5C5YJN6_9BACT|nr:sigma-70 family RNA polymerase sigma factor [Allorhodopirellula solitaria]TWT75037.1 RNA polymerase sigma factor [Allorhodopirellula solitaria]